MMRNVDHEVFVCASGSIACESLPPELQKEYKEGESEVNSGQFTVNLEFSWSQYFMG